MHHKGREEKKFHELGSRGIDKSLDPLGMTAFQQQQHPREKLPPLTPFVQTGTKETTDIPLGSSQASKVQSLLQT